MHAIPVTTGREIEYDSAGNRRLSVRFVNGSGCRLPLCNGYAVLIGKLPARLMSRQRESPRKQVPDGIVSTHIGDCIKQNAVCAFGGNQNTG